MKNNNKALQEAFFRRKSASEKSRSKMGLTDYKPHGTPGAKDNVIAVNNQDEIKKRLTGTFGALVGNSSMKGKTGRSIKKFPIMISDGIDPDTAVMLKKVMEEQYAEFISLLISNEVVDVSELKSAYGGDEKIAIQSLNKFHTNNDLTSKSKMNTMGKRVSHSGAISRGDYLANFNAYNIFRESEEIKESLFGNNLNESNEFGSFLKELMENAIIAKSDEELEIVRNVINEQLEEEAQEKQEVLEENYSVSSKVGVDRFNGKQIKEIDHKIEMINRTIANINDDLYNEKNKKSELEEKIFGAAGANQISVSSYSNDHHDPIVDNYDEMVSRFITEFEKCVYYNNKSNDNEKLFYTDEKSSEGKHILKTINRLRDIQSHNTKDQLAHQGDKVDKYMKECIMVADRYKQEYAENMSSDPGKIRVTLSEIGDSLRLMDSIRRDARAAADKYKRLSGQTVTTSNSSFGSKQINKLSSMYQKELNKVNSKITYLEAQLEKETGEKNRLEQTKLRIQGPNNDTTTVEAINKQVLDGSAQVRAQFEKASSMLVSGIIEPDDYIKFVTEALGLAMSTAEKIDITRTFQRPDNYKKIEAKDLNRKMMDIYSKNDISKLQKYGRKIAMANPWSRTAKNMKKRQAAYLMNKNSDAGVKALIAATTAPKRNDYNPIRSNISSDNRGQFKDFTTLDRTGYDAVNIIDTYNKYVEGRIRDRDASMGLAVNADVEYSDVLDQLNEEIKVMENQEKMEKLGLNEARLGLPSATNRDYKTKSFSRTERSDSKLLDVPTFSTRSQQAYGTAVINRRDQKDRRFHQPLIIEIKFVERYGDGSFADNEMTAVIGILGSLKYIPSDEMKYVLQSNLSGSSASKLSSNLSSIMKATGKGDQNFFSTLLKATNIKDDIKNLPRTHELWNSLNSLSKLALTSKLGGNSQEFIPNAHLIFSIKEVEDIKHEIGVDLLTDNKAAGRLIKKYAAFSLMVANDVQERVHIFDDEENSGWSMVTYRAFKTSGNDSTGALEDFFKSMRR